MTKALEYWVEETLENGRETSHLCTDGEKSARFELRRLRNLYPKRHFRIVERESEPGIEMGRVRNKPGATSI